MGVTLIVPAYNEADRIGILLDTYTQHFDTNLRLHVVVNGCKDETEVIVEKWQQRLPERISYEVYTDTRGKGWAVRKGFAAVRDEFVGFVDADAATPAREMEKVIAALADTRIAGAIASRYAKNAHIVNRVSRMRKITGHMFRFVVRLIVGLPYTDTQCGAKVFRQNVIDTVLPEMAVDNMAFDVELLLLCKKNNFKIVEVPTQWEEKSGSTFITSFGKLCKTGGGMLLTIIQLRLRFLIQ